MENFFYNGEFYSDIESFINQNFDDESEIHELSNDKLFLCTHSKLEPIIKLDAEWICGRIDDDRFSENDSDNEYEEILKTIDENIDFSKVNSLFPKLYYEDYKQKFTISKKDLLDYVK